MSLGSNGNLKFFFSSLLRSFVFAYEGIVSAIKNERNLKIHLVIAVGVIIAGFIFSLSALEWVAVIVAIGGMLSLELLNTAIERIVDLVTDDFHPLAKQAKDAAAGAVLIYAVMSAIIGLIVFVPKILNFL
ncbi:diacylglycerol kinase [Bacillus methanolicus]|uniref:diacylglycerol kinase family protein n=1 Tax=Bacillus methanolicus TaxID=1471 RepID=UPI00238088A8|nr:diacylglycerol kinase family protein [Bacillus methanolicus]MDE3839650.1 diacylglycerol kinase [Bacillus methanolicus]